MEIPFVTGFRLTFFLSALMFVVVFGVVSIGLIRSVTRWNKNEKALLLAVDAEVVARRTARQRPMSDKHYSGRDYTNYYVTFQFETGDRLELELKGHEFGLLVEGDKGKLTFQGTRYLGFERT